MAGQKVLEPSVWKRQVRNKHWGSLALEIQESWRDRQPSCDGVAEGRSEAVNSRQATYLILDKNVQDWILQGLENTYGCLGMQLWNFAKAGNDSHLRSVPQGGRWSSAVVGLQVVVIGLIWISVSVQDCALLWYASAVFTLTLGLDWEQHGKCA